MVFWTMKLGSTSACAPWSTEAGRTDGKLNRRAPGMQKLFTFCLDLGACSSITRTRPNRASCGTPSASLVRTRFVFHTHLYSQENRETPRETTADVVGHDCQVRNPNAGGEARRRGGLAAARARHIGGSTPDLSRLAPTLMDPLE